MKHEVTAFAPATVGNAGVGFDVLGFAVEAVGDRVTVRRIDEPVVRVADIRGVTDDLPRNPDENTATVGLVLMREELGLDYGFEVEIDKGLPLGSGMGGSAASAVAAVVAAAELVDDPLSRESLFRYSLAGEAVASGHAHPDNVAPCLYGGLTLATGNEVRSVPSPDLYVALVHPHLRIDTKMAREVMPKQIPLGTAVQQMGHLAAFLAGCWEGDIAAVMEHCVDLLAEPHRKNLLPGFDAARVAALEAGAGAFSLSGSGPTVFALAPSEAVAAAVADAIAEAFAGARLETDVWVSPFGADGARPI